MAPQPVFPQDFLHGSVRDEHVVLLIEYFTLRTAEGRLHGGLL